MREAFKDVRFPENFDDFQKRTFITKVSKL